jgi:hypothetical protein
MQNQTPTRNTTDFLCLLEPIGRNENCRASACGRVKVSLWAFLLLFLILPSFCFAAIPKAQAVRAIIGEASNQGYMGMLAVACALRNRDSLKGVYGINAKHIDKQPKWVWDMAEKAWFESEFIDITDGADHWHNVEREGETYWTLKMTKTVCIKDHCFYK